MGFSLFFTSFIFFVSFAFANPVGEKVLSGQVSFSRENNTLEIHQQSNQAILQWKEFSIGQKEKTCFIQPKNGSILNRVEGNLPSTIDGLLQGNANLYLMNEKGLIVGKNGRIEAKSFFMLGQDIKEVNFFNQNGPFKIHTDAVIINRGTIKTKEGNIFLIGKEVKNLGKIEAAQGKISLNGGSEVFLQKEQDNHFLVNVKGIGSVENVGLVKAMQVQLQAAGGDIYSLAINQKGMIEANSVVKKEGRVILLAESGNIDISGEIRAKNTEEGGSIEISGKDGIHISKEAALIADGKNKGGSILIGGGYQGKSLNIQNVKKLHIEPGARIKADALEKGNGGKVIAWADEQNLFEGEISAKGGSFEGDGGFVEISCPKNLGFLGKVDTTAPNGLTGGLLLDPSNIVIDDFGGSSTPTFPTTPPGAYNPTESVGLLDVANLQTALALTNVTVSTAGGTGGSGTVTINSGFTWSAATTFSVTANRNIILDGVTISNTNLLGGFTAVDLQAGQPRIVEGNFDGIFMRNSTISSQTGAINLLARGGTLDNNYGIHLFGSTISSLGSVLDTATITLNGTGGAGVNGISGVVVESNSSVNSLLGNISITGISNGSGAYNHGIRVFLSSEVRSSGLGLGAATVTLDGTSSAGTTDNYGVNIQENSTISSNIGNVDITATSNGTQEQNVGLQITRGGRIASVGTVASAATIIIQATSGSGANTNQGIFMDSNASVESINGNIGITAGSRGRNIRRNHGVLLTNFSFIRSTGAILNAADITIIGTPGTGETIGTKTDLTSDVTVVDGVLNITGGFERGRFP